MSTAIPPQNMMQRMMRWKVDSDGNMHGSGFDTQARVNARTGQHDHAGGMLNNAGEAFWDAVSLKATLIPGFGNAIAGGINVARGAVKGLYGLVTGKGYLAKEGLRNIGKGILYAIPIVGTAVAGLNLAKNGFDTVVHGAGAVSDLAKFGGNKNKQKFAMQMMYGNMGMGMGMAHPGMMRSPGRW